MSLNRNDSGCIPPDPEHFPAAELISLLESRNQSHDDQALIEHLSNCARCQHQLESAAGCVEDWEHVQQAFQAADAYDLPDFSLDPPQDANCAWNDSVQADVTDLLKLLTPCDDPRAAGRIGTFEIIGIVGSGGMGIVLKAKDPVLDRFVAIKLLAPHLACSESARRRFAREARAAAAVLHDNVIAIYQVAHWRNLPYLVMPYLPDPSLQQRLDQSGGLDLESCLVVGMQLARGLAAAHSQGLVHRDVKPANVLLCNGTNRAIITDFGLARAADDASITRAGAITGTPHYMSPEQARGEPVDQASDLFSLGSVLFAMSAGRPPVACELGSETIERIARCEMPPLIEVNPAFPAWYARLVDWLHSAKRENRPQSSQIVADLLAQCVAHLRQPDRASPPPQLIDNQPNASLQGLTVASVLILLLVAISTVAVLSESRATSANSALGDKVAEELSRQGEIQRSTGQDHEAALATPLNDSAREEWQWSKTQEELDAVESEIWRLEDASTEFWSIHPVHNSDSQE